MNAPLSSGLTFWPASLDRRSGNPLGEAIEQREGRSDHDVDASSASATRGMNWSVNAVSSAAFLCIFQLAARIGLRTGYRSSAVDAG